VEIAGVRISDEAIGALLFAIGGLLTAFGIWIRASSKKIEANAKEIEAGAVAKASSAEAELAERLSVTNSLKQYGELLQSQITINQQLKERADQQETAYQKRLEEKEKQDENNYHVLSQTQDRHAQEIQTQLQNRFDRVEKKIDDLPGKLQADTKEWVQTIVAEVATQIAERFAEMTMAQEWYPFPDVNDPEWKEDFVKPLINRVRLYRRPVSSESSLTDAEVPQTGTTMKIIKGRKRGWLVVRRVGGSDTQYGWLPEHEVLVGMSAVKKATGEAMAVAIPTQVIPAN